MAKTFTPRVTPVRLGNVYEETLERLLQLIRLGQFAPGQKMPPERELAEALGVSRTTLRDALADLQGAGYVTVARGRYGGTHVADTLPAPEREPWELTAGVVHDVLTCRDVVEPAVSQLTAQRGVSAADLASLRATQDAIGAAPAHHYRPLDSRFHLAIADLCGSPTLAGIVLETRARINELLDHIPLLVPNLEHSTGQHEAILAAIEQGDGALAAEVTREHLEGTASLLRGFLD